MSKKKRRLSKRFKRTIGITFASLFLLSAIIVALLPQRDVSAYSSTSEVFLEDSENSVPIIQNTDVIYTTGDGLFQFAYITKNSGANRIAVICGYDFERSLPGGNLTIPDTVDAYIKLTDTDGTEGGYVAVSMSNEPLYYATYKEEEYYENVVDENGYPVYLTDEDGNIQYDDQGNPIPKRELKTREVIDSYLPCYYKTIDAWSPEKADGSGEREDKDLFYKVTDNSGNVSYVLTVDDLHKRMKDAQVNYIANQNVVKDGDTWKLNTSDSDGIFSKAKNIVNLEFGDQLIGIGNYAFANCANLSKITFGDGLNTLGNYAFADCHNLKEVDLPFNSSISVIGEKAFYNCQGLQSFSLPTGVTKIGDSCFEGCIDMKTCVLDVPDMNMSLERIGKNVFKDCTSLEYIEFPRNFKNDKASKTDSSKDLDVSWFSGCKSLKHIKVPNTMLTFKDSTSYTFEDFKNELPKEFYFEGVKDEELHKTSKNNAFAFKYLDEEIYEKVIHEDNNPSNEHSKIVYQVNDQNQLIYFEMGDQVSNVDIPEKIGPYNVSVIGSDSFSNNCILESITIPSTINEIEAEAFKGCHNLKRVTFSKPINLSYIGDGAFDTQVVSTDVSGKHYCNGSSTATTLTTTPELTFVGEAVIGSAPFDYAMDPDSNINNPDQVETYITFETSWPNNLVVQYNPTKGENELIQYPSFNDLNNFQAKYPNATTEQAAAALKAYQSNGNTSNLTDNEKGILNAALNPTLPNGITAIKEGLFSGVDSEGNATGGSKDTKIMSITTEGVKKIDNYAFKDLPELQAVYLKSGTTSLGDKAFENCDKLVDVDIYSDLTEFGETPFLDCDALEGVDFGTNKNFMCQDAIIYSLVNGQKDSLLEVLKTRGDEYGSGTINPSELEGIKSIAKSAFKNCDAILSVDLTDAKVSQIPESAFENTDSLYSVKLNDGTTTVGPNAFKNSNIRYVEIPKSTSIIDNTAFADDDQNKITFYCEEDSPAAYFAANHPNISVSTKPIQFHVYFYDDDTTTLLDTVIVDAGGNATTSVIPSKAGYTFEGWYPKPEGITEDNFKTYAKYVGDTVTVTFVDWDDSIIDTEEVLRGGDCRDRKDPVRAGYRFVGWRPGITNVTEDRIVYAQYEEYDPNAEFTVKFYDYDDTLLHTQTVKAGEDCIEVKDPKRDGYTFTGWKPSIKNVTEDRVVYAQYEKNDPNNNNNNGNNGNNGNNNNGNNGENGNNGNNNNGNNGSNNGSNSGTQMYTLSVIGGSGSGSYVPGATIIIMANNPESGKVFDKWTYDEGVSILKPDLAATYVTMPAKNCTITANYKASGSNGQSNNNSGNNGSGNTSNVITPNTTVSLTKTGFSNNGLASASVSGSSDNFVLKITDSQTAKAEIEDALLAKYDTLDNIKYVAMDISLYDSTGSKKIENTSDLKVSVTLPIPDDLVPYAGNNRVAYVVNGKLVDINPKFTTINGVPCINFVAPHFSPYTIYVDTQNLSSSVNYTSTSTPKTGDGIPVKWFVSLGLLAMSLIFFALCIPTGIKRKAK